jgi:hypothetical protein
VGALSPNPELGASLINDTFLSIDKSLQIEWVVHAAAYLHSSMQEFTTRA